MEIMICNVSIANVFNEASHKSELHTQILFGETVSVLEKNNDCWMKIQSENKEMKTKIDYLPFISITIVAFFAVSNLIFLILFSYYVKKNFCNFSFYWIILEELIVF